MLLRRVGLRRNVPIVTFLVTGGASCRALQGSSTIDWVFRKHRWWGLPLVRGGRITTFVAKTGVKWQISAIKLIKIPFSWLGYLLFGLKYYLWCFCKHLHSSMSFQLPFWGSQAPFFCKSGVKNAFSCQNRHESHINVIQYHHAR